MQAHFPTRSPERAAEAFSREPFALCGLVVALVACSASGGADGVPDFGAGGSTNMNVSPGANAGGTTSNPLTPAPGMGGSGEGTPPIGGLNPAGGSAGSGGSVNAPVGAGGTPVSSGGSSGSGPAGGAGGSGTAGAGSGQPLDCGDPSLLFCEDFDADTAGAFPGAAEWLPEAGGCGSHTVSAAVPAHSGAQSLQATGAGYPGCMVHADVTGEDELYVRSWVRLGAPSTDSGHHVALLELGPRSNQDDPEFRIGMRADAPCTDPGIDVTVGGLSAGERTECSGVDLNANQWYCLEAHFLKQNGSVTFDVRVDGMPVVAETTYTGLNAEWTDALFFKFGRASYGGNNTWSVWHDDIAVGTAPIGCQ